MKREVVDISTKGFLTNFFNADDRIHILAIKEGDKKESPRTIDFEFADIEERLESLKQLNNEGYGLYYTVNHGGTKDKEITRINAHFMEIDDISLDEQWKRIKEFPLPPSIIVYSGGKSYHTYWLVKDAEVGHFRNIQQGLINWFNADQSVKNEAQKLRLPGFFNRKTSDRKRCEVVYFNPTRIYTQDELKKHVTVIEMPIYREGQSIDYDNDTESTEFEEFRDMVAIHLDKERYQANGNKTGCCCIMPDHNESNPSAVFFWDTNTYHCSGCSTDMRILDVLELAGDFDEAIMFAKQHEIYSYKPKEDDKELPQIGYSFTEYMEGVEFQASKITGIEQAPLVVFGKDFNSTAKEIALQTGQATTETLIKRNGSIDVAHAMDIRAISRLFAYPNRIDKITAISGQPGFAKTTLLKHFIKTACKLDETFGAVIVCRTIKDMKEMADYFNGKTDIDGNDNLPSWLLDKPTERPIAFVMESWKPELCLAKHKEYVFGMCRRETCEKYSLCRHTEKYGKQKSYPIVLMTHERLLRDSEEAGHFVKTYGTWGDFCKTHNRRVVIIDEKPELIRTTLIDHNAMSKLVRKVKEASLQQKEQHDENVYFIVKDIENIEGFLNSLGETRGDKASIIDVGKYIKGQEEILQKCFIRLKGFINKFIGSDEYKLVAEIEQMLFNGFAVLTTHHGIDDEAKKWQVASARWMGLDIQDMNVFILDGTCDISPDYADPKRFQRYECSDIRSYSNWTIHHVNTSISKTKLQGRQDNVMEVNKRIAQVAREYIIPNHDKTLIVTLKTNVNKLTALLREEINKGKVVVAYDGNLIGTNEYKDFTAIAFTSHIELPPALIEASSSLVELSILDKSVDDEGFYGTYSTFKYKNRHYYELELMEAVRLLKTAENMVQGALRIDRDPNSKKKVDLWILDRNAQLCELIKKKLPGSEIQTEVIDELMVRRSTAATYILHELALDAIGESLNGKLPKSKLAEVAGITPDALRRNLIRKDVQKLFAEKGLKITRWHIEPA